MNINPIEDLVLDFRHFHFFNYLDIIALFSGDLIELVVKQKKTIYQCIACGLLQVIPFFNMPGIEVYIFFHQSLINLSNLLL